MYKVDPSNVTTITDATTEPVSVTTAKAFLRVDITDDDTLIGNLITAARLWAENYCGRSFTDKTLRADLPGFYDNIWLPFGPVYSVSSVKYWDTASPSVLQTWASTNYNVFYNTLERNYGISFESTYPRSDAVQITYRVGYIDGSPEADATPQAVIQSILLMVGDMYEHREAQIMYPGQLHVNKTAEILLNPYRLYR